MLGALNPENPERSGCLPPDMIASHASQVWLLSRRRRFMARREEAAKIYDERFCRMWEFYLAGSETSFRHEGMVNFQLQLTRKIDALPITRDYMGDEERQLSAAPMRERLRAGE